MHTVQLRISCGNSTAEKSKTVWLKPITKGNVVDVLEVAAKVNAVDQDIQIERIRKWFSRIGGIEERIGRIPRNRIKGIRVSIRGMTLHADFHFGPNAAVKGKGLVTPLAVLRLHHLPRPGACRHRAEVERGVVDKRSPATGVRRACTPMR